VEGLDECLNVLPCGGNARQFELHKAATLALLPALVFITFSANSDSALICQVQQHIDVQTSSFPSNQLCYTFDFACHAKTTLYRNA
jgi:hypothetical protein